MSFHVTPVSRYKVLYQQDPDFLIQEGLVIRHRAGLEISNRCPEHIVRLINTAFNHGWIKLQATVEKSKFEIEPHQYELEWD